MGWLLAWLIAFLTALIVFGKSPDLDFRPPAQGDTMEGHREETKAAGPRESRR